MRKTTIVSDLTGREYTADGRVGGTKITVDGKSGTRDLTPEESAALAAWLAAPADDSAAIESAASALRALLAPPAPAPAPAASKTRKSKSGSGSKGSDPRNTAIREWAATPEGRTALGLSPDAEISARGRLPKEYAEKYDAAHGTPAPAATPAATPAAA